MKKILLFSVVFFGSVFFNTYICLAQWVLQHSGYEVPGIWTRYISALDSNTVWSSGQDSYNQNPGLYFSYTLDGGNHWNAGKIPSNILYNENIGFSCVNDSTAWILGATTNYDATIIYKTQDYGQTWITQYPVMAGNNLLSHIHFFNENEGLCWTNQILDDYFEMYRTTDGGDSWIRVSQTSLPLVLNVSEHLSTYCALNNNIWITVINSIFSRLIYSGDKGLTWSSILIPSLPGGHAQVAFKDSLNGLVNNWSGYELSATHNNGQTWESNWLGPGTLQLLYIPGSATTFVAMSGDGLVYSMNDGHNWSSWPSFNMQIFCHTWADPSHGWAGSKTTDPEPWNTGIWKYTGTLTSLPKAERINQDVNFFPNPAHSVTAFEINGFPGEKIALQVFDNQGQIVIESTVITEDFSCQYELDVHHLHPGLYFFQLRSGQKMIGGKLLVE